MISSKRLDKIRKELEKHKGKTIIITFTDGSKLEVNSHVISDSFVKFNQETDFIKAIREKEIASCSELGKLISLIQQLSKYE